MSLRRHSRFSSFHKGQVRSTRKKTKNTRYRPSKPYLVILERARMQPVITPTIYLLRQCSSHQYRVSFFCSWLIESTWFKIPIHFVKCMLLARHHINELRYIELIFIDSTRLHAVMVLVVAAFLNTEMVFSKVFADPFVIMQIIQLMLACNLAVIIHAMVHTPHTDKSYARY